MQAITLEVILRAVFGVREGERMERFREAIPRLGAATSVLSWLPFMQRDIGGVTPGARFRRAVEEVDRLIYAEIDQRRSEGEGDDVLSLLLQARHEDGSAMTDVELRDQLVTLLTAGTRPPPPGSRGRSSGCCGPPPCWAACSSRSTTTTTSTLSSRKRFASGR